MAFAIISSESDYYINGNAGVTETVERSMDSFPAYFGTVYTDEIKSGELKRIYTVFCGGKEVKTRSVILYAVNRDDRLYVYFMKKTRRKT